MVDEKSFYAKAAAGEVDASLVPKNIYTQAVQEETEALDLEDESASSTELSLHARLSQALFGDAEAFYIEDDIKPPAVVSSGAPPVELQQTEPAEQQPNIVQPAAPEPPSPEGICDSIVHYLGQNGVLAHRYSHFHERRGQLQMAQQVLQTMRNCTLLLAEAGTGTGKTFAYLIPAIINGSKVVISTGSKALQDQLVNSDIPKLLQLMQRTNITYMGLKGFANYLCQRRFKQAVLGHELSDAELQRVQDFIAKEEAALLHNPYACTFGDVHAHFPQTLAQKLTIARQRCLGEKCPYAGDMCFALKARQYAAESQIVVINHALLFAAIGSRQLLDEDKQELRLQALSFEEIEAKAQAGKFSEHYWFLPAFNTLICDEAHMLPDYGRTFYSHEFDSAVLTSWTDNLLRELKVEKVAGRRQFKDPCAQMLQALADAVDYLVAYEGKCTFLQLKYENYHSDTDKAQLTPNVQFRDLMAGLYAKMMRVKKLLKEQAELKQELFAKLSLELNEMMMTLALAMNCDEPSRNGMADDNHVCYATISLTRFIFTLAPIEIGPYFSKELAFMLHSKRSLVMTSATLSVHGSFAKFAWDIGAAGLKPQTLLVDSTFDYERQASLYLSADFPPVNDMTRNSILVQQLGPIMDAVPGGIFFLTTSHRSLQENAELLTAYFAGTRRVLIQAGGKSNARLMHDFKEDGHAVLVGTSSFWAGVDVPGQALMLVIIDKLPFASPVDPFEQARADKFKAQGGQPFIQISLPEAIIALRQGVGRLIRTEHDQGGLIICDPRICTARYGKMIVEALPPMHRCASLNAMKDFFKGLKQ